MNNHPNPFPRIVIQEQALPKQEQGTAQARRIPFTRRISFGKEILLSFHQNNNIVLDLKTTPDPLIKIRNA